MCAAVEIDQPLVAIAAPDITKTRFFSGCSTIWILQGFGIGAKPPGGGQLATGFIFRSVRLLMLPSGIPSWAKAVMVEHAMTPAKKRTRARRIVTDSC